MPQPLKVTLGIDLQDGFADDTVVVKVKENEVFQKEHINTSMLLGFATTFKTEVRQGRVSVKVEIPTKNIKRTIMLEILNDVYLGISVVNSIIDYIISDEPFGYL